MKLTGSDIEYLKKIGCLDRDMRQIEEAASKTVYMLNFEKRISQKEAIKLLGRKTFLSGLSRSAFHYSAVRGVEGSEDNVYFDSRAYFKTNTKEILS